MTRLAVTLALAVAADATRAIPGAGIWSGVGLTVASCLVGWLVEGGHLARWLEARRASRLPRRAVVRSWRGARA